MSSLITGRDMAEYCEYMWDPPRGRSSIEFPYNYYDTDMQYDKKDKKLAINIVRAILRQMPNADLSLCTDEYITRFLLARKYRVEQTASLIAAYQAQIAHRQDIFGNLTARDPALQRALRAGIPGVLPARDRKGRCVLIILASQWDPVAVPAISVQRAIFLVLEILIQDIRNQENGFVVVVDWNGFSLRQGSALGIMAVRNLIAALRGQFPARFKAIHFLSAPLYVQATLIMLKPFLGEKIRNKIYLHGNNLSSLHEHLPTDILPAELGGTGPAFNPGLWAEPVIHSAMKEAERAAAAAAAAKEEKKQVEASASVQEPAANLRDESETANGNHQTSDGSNVPRSRQEDNAKTSSLNNSGSPVGKRSSRKNARKVVEMNVIRKSTNQEETVEFMTTYIDNPVDRVNNGNIDVTLDAKTDQPKDKDALLDAESEINSNSFEMIPSRSDSENSSLDNGSAKAFIIVLNKTTPTENMNFIV